MDKLSDNLKKIFLAGIGADCRFERADPEKRRSERNCAG